MTGKGWINMKRLMIILIISLILLTATLTALASGSAIEGRTWVYYHSTFVRWSGVQVELQQDGQVITTTISEYGGVYAFSGIPDGIYDLVGDVKVGCSCYHGVRAGVVVSGNVDGQNILLYQHGLCCKYRLPMIMKRWGGI
jgi:hypothetical protein